MRRLVLAVLLSCTANLPCPVLAALPAPPPPDTLLFDGQREDGERVLMQIAPGMPAQTLGTGIVGRRPRIRPNDGAIAYHTLATELEPSRLMLLSDTRATTLPRGISLDPWVQEREIAWSPDGRRIAFHSQFHEPAGVVFVAEVGQAGLLGAVNLTAPSGGQQAIEPDVTPAWSPDGRQIVLTSYRSGRATLWVFDADGRHPRQLTQDGLHGDYFADWSPDGQLIAFQRNDNAGARIGLVARGGGGGGGGGGGAPMFLDLPGNAYQPAFSPDGERLAVTITFADGERDLAIVNLDGSQLLRLPHVGDDMNPHWVKPRISAGCSADRSCLRRRLVTEGHGPKRQR